MLYQLEVLVNENWDADERFPTVDAARRYALQNFPHNGWRIVNRSSGAVEIDRPALVAMVSDLRSDLDRFSRTEAWARRMASRLRRPTSAVPVDLERLQAATLRYTEPNLTSWMDMVFNKQKNKNQEPVNWFEDGF